MTERSKGVMLTQRNLVANISQYPAVAMRGGDRVVAVLRSDATGRPASRWISAVDKTPSAAVPDPNKAAVN